MSTGLSSTEAAVTVPINLTAPAIIPHPCVSPLSGGCRWLRLVSSFPCHRTDTAHEREAHRRGASALGALVGGGGGRGLRGVLRALLLRGGAAGGLAGGAAGLRGHLVAGLLHVGGHLGAGVGQRLGR